MDNIIDDINNVEKGDKIIIVNPSAAINLELFVLDNVGTLIVGELTDLDVVRRAKKMLRGVACGCIGVVCVFSFRLRCLSAFLEGMCGRLMPFVLDVRF